MFLPKPEINKLRLIHADNRAALKNIAVDSIDAVVTDPPYELGFMGRAWDATGIAYDVDLWREALRVLKPGGYLLAFGGTRTYHRMACAIEDAGFVIRDMVQWLYGMGFPKNYNISKAIDAKLLTGKSSPSGINKSELQKNTGRKVSVVQPYCGILGEKRVVIKKIECDLITDEAKQWDGWGTALKPANEPICLARKPLSEKTIAENVLKHGTGGLNIDGCRVGTESRVNLACAAKGHATAMQWGSKGTCASPPTKGRWPANVILDGSEEVLAEFAKAGERPTGVCPADCSGGYGGFPTERRNDRKIENRGDTGSAARFFYCAKASPAERNAGLTGQKIRVEGGGGTGNEEAAGKYGSIKAAKRNHHPTVKPISLMRYLIRLITPPGGIVLDPFMGSGTTGIAAFEEGVSFIGIEKDAGYFEIAQRRIAHARRQGRLNL